MSTEPAPSLCFSCGGPADQLNELDEGESCPACAERLLESLPGVFHAPWATAEPADEPARAEAEEEAEEPAEAGPRQYSRRPTGDPFRRPGGGDRPA